MLVASLLLLSLALALSLCVAFHSSHRVSCTRKKLCNGNLMCAYVCEKGSVQVDAWTSQALAYQRQLQADDKFVFMEFPSTHNSAITEADGFGIEKYFISALYGGINLDQGDDVGEGLCQYLSLTDQLRIGIRHLEIDIWWAPVEKDVIVCHSPIPLFPVGNVSRTAEARNISLEWKPDKMSCIGTKRRFLAVLKEVRDWMMKPENLNEIVGLYIDTKFYLSPDQVTQANSQIETMFGSMLWKPSDGNPLQTRVKDMLAMGKRIFIENQKECWTKPSSGEPLVFYPALWTHQFGSNSMTEFPSCVVEGDSNWYGSQWVRALDGSFIEAATRCGVQLASGDYINPDDMKYYVWSWDQKEPSSSTGCVAMLPSGRWATLDCSTPLPYACVSDNSAENGDYSQWNIDLNNFGSWDKSTCASGFRFSAPHNGFANSLLTVAGVGQTIWLNAPNPLRT
jgi:hypothetical protein